MKKQIKSVYGFIVRLEVFIVVQVVAATYGSRLASGIRSHLCGPPARLFRLILNYVPYLCSTYIQMHENRPPHMINGIFNQYHRLNEAIGEENCPLSRINST